MNIILHKKKIIFGILLVIYFLIMSTLSYLLFNSLGSRLEGDSKETESQAILTSTSSSDPLAPYNVLLLGYGGAGHPGGTLADGTAGENAAA